MLELPDLIVRDTYLSRKPAQSAVWVAVALFGVSGDLVYFASEAKQYSSDVASALAMILLGLTLGARPLTAPRAALLGAAGVTVVWFSHPSIFVLIGLPVLLYPLRDTWLLVKAEPGRIHGTIERCCQAVLLECAKSEDGYRLGTNGLARSGARDTISVTATPRINICTELMVIGPKW